MHRAINLDLTDVYIIAMMGQGFMLAEISEALNIVPAATTQRLNKIKRLYPDFCEKTKGKDAKGRHTVTLMGQHFSDCCLTFLEQLTGDRVRYPTAKTHYVYKTMI